MYLAFGIYPKIESRVAFPYDAAAMEEQAQIGYHAAET
jgi:hypothetical protein